MICLPRGDGKRWRKVFSLGASCSCDGILCCLSSNDALSPTSPRRSSYCTQIQSSMDSLAWRWSWIAWPQSFTVVRSHARRRHMDTESRLVEKYGNHRGQGATMILQVVVNKDILINENSNYVAYMLSYTFVFPKCFIFHKQNCNSWITSVLKLIHFCKIIVFIHENKRQLMCDSGLWLNPLWEEGGQKAPNKKHLLLTSLLFPWGTHNSDLNWASKNGRHAWLKLFFQLDLINNVGSNKTLISSSHLVRWDSLIQQHWRMLANI